jgi:hypothetical protein
LLADDRGEGDQGAALKNLDIVRQDGEAKFLFPDSA